MENNSLRDNESYKPKTNDSDAPATGEPIKSTSDRLRDEHDRLVCRGPATVEKVNEGNFSRLALAAFDQIDINKDNSVDKAELEHALDGNSKVPCASMDAARIMLKNFDVVKSFEGMDSITASEEGRGYITKRDLLKFEDIRAGDGLFKGYAKESLVTWGIGTGALGYIGGSAASIGFTGSSLVAFGIGAISGTAAAAAVGVGIGAGLNYYSYRQNHVPKVRTFFDDINASAELRSRI